MIDATLEAHAVGEAKVRPLCGELSSICRPYVGAVKVDGNAQCTRNRVRKLEKALLETCPDSRVNGDPDNRLPNTANISFEYVEGEAILLLLDRHGICASSGSACTSGSLEPSHVLKAMHVPFTAMHGSVRFSLSRYTTAAEVDRVIEVFPEVVASLRRISPYWDAARNAPRPTAPQESPAQPTNH